MGNGGEIEFGLIGPDPHESGQAVLVRTQGVNLSEVEFLNELAEVLLKAGASAFCADVAADGRQLVRHCYPRRDDSGRAVTFTQVLQVRGRGSWERKAFELFYSKESPLSVESFCRSSQREAVNLPVIRNPIQLQGRAVSGGRRIVLRRFVWLGGRHEGDLMWAVACIAALVGPGSKLQVVALPGEMEPIDIAEWKWVDFETFYAEYERIFKGLGSDLEIGDTSENGAGASETDGATVAGRQMIAQGTLTERVWGPLEEPSASRETVPSSDVRDAMLIEEFEAYNQRMEKITRSVGRRLWGRRKNVGRRGEHEAVRQELRASVGRVEDLEMSEVRRRRFRVFLSALMTFHIAFLEDGEIGDVEAKLEEELGEDWSECWEDLLNFMHALKEDFEWSEFGLELARMFAMQVGEMVVELAIDMALKERGT